MTQAAHRAPQRPHRGPQGPSRGSRARLQVPGAFRPLLYSNARYKVFPGGRGAAKDWSVARALITIASREPKRVLCLREIQKSIRDSAHRLLRDQIETANLGGFFTVTDNEIRGINGSLFLFRGVRHNTTEIKSIEGIDIAWANEAQAFTAESWEIIDPTIRKNGSQIWVTYNPDGIDDATHKRFVTDRRPDAVVRHVTFRDNPFLPDVLWTQMLWDRENRPDLYEWKWEGKPRVLTDALVFAHHYKLEHIPGPPNAEPMIGLDFGFSQDPSAAVRCYIHEGRLWTDKSAGGIGIDITDLPNLLDKVLPRNEKGEILKRWPVRADSARPETISYLKRQGYNVIPVKKGIGSIEDGIEYIKGFEDWIIDPEQAREVAEEAALYSYKTDRITGDVLPVLVDAHNHYIDATRYALEPHMRNARRTRVKVNRRII